MLALIASSHDVNAQVPPDEGADRRGFYVRAGGGPGYSRGTYEFSGMSSPAFAPIVPLHFETTAHGPHGEFSLALGHAVVPGVAVAGEAAGRLIPMLFSGRMANTELNAAVAGKVGVVVDVFPSPPVGAHLLAAAGWSAATFAYSRDDEGAPDNIVNPDQVTGPYFELGAGYVADRRIDYEVRLSYASLEGAQSSYRPLGVTFLFSYLRF